MTVKEEEYGICVKAMCIRCTWNSFFELNASQRAHTHTQTQYILFAHVLNILPKQFIVNIDLRLSLNLLRFNVMVFLHDLRFQRNKIRNIHPVEHSSEMRWMLMMTIVRRLNRFIIIGAIVRGVCTVLHTVTYMRAATAFDSTRSLEAHFPVLLLMCACKTLHRMRMEIRSFGSNTSNDQWNAALYAIYKCVKWCTYRLRMVSTDINSVSDQYYRQSTRNMLCASHSTAASKLSAKNLTSPQISNEWKWSSSYFQLTVHTAQRLHDSTDKLMK